MYRLVFTTLLLLSVVFSAQAKRPARPKLCPRLSVLKSQRLVFAEKGTDGYIVGTMGNFDTAYFWGFAIAPIKAKSLPSAKTLAARALKIMSGAPRPQYIASEKTWACIYNLPGKPYKAVSMTPVPGMLNNSISLLH